MESGNKLPPFPVDDGTLGLLLAALQPDPEAERSSLWDFLALMSEMGGSDLTAVSEVMHPQAPGEPEILMMRDPCYSDHDVIEALIIEIRRLRGQAES